MLFGYLALAARLGFEQTLDLRARMLAAQLAAELSGCRWCIEQGRHDWRVARLPPMLLRRLRDHATGPLFNQRERTALAFIEAASQIAELARCLADHHFLDDSIP